MAYVDIKPIPIRERAAILSVGAAQIDVADQGFVLIAGLAPPVDAPEGMAPVFETAGEAA